MPLAQIVEAFEIGAGLSKEDVERLRMMVGTADEMRSRPGRFVDREVDDAEMIGCDLLSHEDAADLKRTSFPTRADAHYWATEGDLLITRSNTPELVGHAAIHSGSPVHCIYPDLMMKLRLDKSRTDTRFVWYWLQSTVVRDHIKRFAKGTSPTMKKISQSIVGAIPFPVHLSIDQQTDIVAKLRTFQEKLDAVRVLQIETATELDAMLPAILDKAFRGELS